MLLTRPGEKNSQAAKAAESKVRNSRIYCHRERAIVIACSLTAH